MSVFFSRKSQHFSLYIRLGLNSQYSARAKIIEKLTKNAFSLAITAVNTYLSQKVKGFQKFGLSRYLAMGVTVTSNHFAYPRRDDQAELAWVAQLNTKMVHPHTNDGPSQY